MPFVCIIHQVCRLSALSIRYAVCLHYPSGMPFVCIVHQVCRLSALSIRYAVCLHYPSGMPFVCIVHQVCRLSALSIRYAVCLHCPSGMPFSKSKKTRPQQSSFNPFISVRGPILDVRVWRRVYRRLGAKGSYLTLVRVADRILQLRGDDIDVRLWCLKSIPALEE